MTRSAAAPTARTPTWQHPYVEVIRYGFAHHNVGWQQNGDVEQVTDSQIQKNVFKIRGTIAATNYVRFPREVSKSNQGLGLTGQYVYLQLRRARGQQATLHLDLLTAKKSALRFSFSSMYSSVRSSGTVLRVPLDVSEVWTTIAIDMAELLRLHGFNGYSRENYRYLKAVTCCASMNLRNVFTSSTCYTPQTIPANLALPVAHENQFGPFGWLVLPTALGIRMPADTKVKDSKRQPGVEDGSDYFDLQGLDSHEEDEEDSDDGYVTEDYAAVSPMPAPSAASQSPAHPTKPIETTGTGGPPLSPSSRTAGLIRDREDVLSRADQIMRDAGFAVPSPRRRVQHQGPPHENQVAVEPKDHRVATAAVPTVLSPRRFLASEHSDWPDPILSLTRIIGFSAAFPRALRWIPDAPACVYTSYSTIIVREFTADGGNRPKRDVASLLTHEQHQEVATRSHTDEALTDDHEVFLTGHTGEICALEISQDGALLASAQNTPQSVLRLWDLRKGSNECVIVMNAPTKTIHALVFSKDASTFCCVGADDHARTQIFVWDSSSLLASAATLGGVKKLVLRARQTCDFPIHAVAFSPYETDQLVTCGKENVRFWRINDARHHLPGSPVILKEYSRGTVFTDLAFDGVYPQFPSNLSRVRPLYVSSTAGSILVINYDTREVVCVYKLHDAAIHSMRVNEGFCVTGSDDKYLRVWPLDFSDFFLEAEHEAPVKSVDVSSDGMRVAVGTSNGAIGILHLADQRYRTVLRSHAQPIGALAPLPDASFVTSAADGTLRVWDSTTGTQTMEFDVAKDLVTCLTAMPTMSVDAMPRMVAVGFRSGCTRIFSLGNGFQNATECVTPTEPRVLYEFQQHQSSLCDVQYQSDGKTFYSSASGQQLCMHDVTQGYAPIKMLIADIDADHAKLCLSRDRRFLAVLQHGRRSVLLLDAASLCVIRVLAPPKSSHATSSDSLGNTLEVTQVAISWNSQELLMLTHADRLHVFSLSESLPSPQASVQFGHAIHSMPLLGQLGITSFALSPNLKYMATGGSDNSVRIWQCEVGKHKFLRMNQTFRLHAGPGAVRGLVFSSDGRCVIATSDSSSAAFVWRFRGNISKLPVLELDENATGPLVSGAQPGHKAEFELPLEHLSKQHELVAVDEDSPKPVEEGKLEWSTTSVSINWRRVIPAMASSGPQSVVWASGLGCFLSCVAGGNVVVIEKLESGKQHFLHISHSTQQLVLSPTQLQLAIVPLTLDFVTVCALEDLRRETNQTEDNISDDSDRFTPTLTRVQFPRLLDSLSAIEFSVDGTLLCISGVASREAQLFVVDIESGGDLMWSVSVARTRPITSILSQSQREFLCTTHDARTPFLRLRVPPFALSAAALSLESVVDTPLPTPPQLFCFRDDGAKPALGEATNGDHLQRCRFAVAVDSDAYCYFVDLDRRRKVHTMQLLLPSTRSRIVAMEWIGTNEWQALIATLSDDTIAVFPLPTQFVFSTSKTRVATIDWVQLKRTGRLSSGTVLAFEGQKPIVQVLTDPMSDVGIVVTRDGSTTVTNFHTGHQRLLRAASTLELTDIDAVSPQVALHGAVLLTLSGDRRSLQCWESTIGRELARLHVPNTLCACFTVSPFDAHLAAAGYDDGSLRLFDLNEQQLVAQCVLPPISQRGRPTSGGKTRGAASPAEALSILKQKQAMRRKASLASPASPSGDAKGFSALHFIGPRCILAVTSSSSRIVLFDLSDVTLNSAAASGGPNASDPPDGARGKRAAVARPKPKAKEKENSIHYRELHLPTPDRMKWIPKAQRSAVQIGSGSAGWGAHVESIDVQLVGGQNPQQKHRSRAVSEDDDGSVLGSTQAFLVVARMTERRRKTSFVVAHVFAANDAPASHAVHAEDDVSPSDSWILPSPARPLFHPTKATQVVYLVVDDERTQWVETRDTQAHAAVLRLALPTTRHGDADRDGDDSGVPFELCRLVRWCVQGNPAVVAVSAETQQAVAVIDLAKRTALPVDYGCAGPSVPLPLSGSMHSASTLLLAITNSPNASNQSPCAQSEDAAAGLVVAELTRSRPRSRAH